MFEIVNFWFK